MKFLTICILFFISYSSLASEIKGNGGDAIKCFDTASGKYSYELFDYYEGKTIRGYSYNHNLTFNNIDDASSYLTENIKRFSPSIHQRFSSNLMKLIDRIKRRDPNIAFLEDISLVDEPDTSFTHYPDKNTPILIPKNCEIIQVLTKANYGKYEFLLDIDTFNKLSYLHQAGLLLHTAIRGKIRSFVNSNSIATRLLNSFFGSVNITDDSLIDLTKVFKGLRHAHLDNFIWNSTEYSQVWSIHSPQQIREGFLAYPQEFSFLEQKLTLCKKISYGKTGYLNKFFLCNENNEDQLTISFKGESYVLKNNSEHEFYSNGQPSLVNFDEKINFNDANYQVTCNSQVSFHQTNHLKLCNNAKGKVNINNYWVKINHTWFTASSNPWRYPYARDIWAPLSFDKNGKVTDGYLGYSNKRSRVKKVKIKLRNKLTFFAGRFKIYPQDTVFRELISLRNQSFNLNINGLNASVSSAYLRKNQTLSSIEIAKRTKLKYLDSRGKEKSIRIPAMSTVKFDKNEYLKSWHYIDCNKDGCEHYYYKIKNGEIVKAYNL